MNEEHRHFLVRVTGMSGLAAHIVDGSGQPMCKIRLNSAKWQIDDGGQNVPLVCRRCETVAAKGLHQAHA